MAKTLKKQGNKIIQEEEVAQNTQEAIAFLDAQIGRLNFYIQNHQSQIAAWETERNQAQTLRNSYL